MASSKPKKMEDEGPQAGQEGANQANANNTPPPPLPPLNWHGALHLIQERKIDFGLWATRLLTLLCAAGYIFPIFGNPVSFYYKAFMATAATSALRLHQRLPNIQFNRAFFNLLVQEDSFHYLFFSMIFLYTTPITLALAPAVLFATLHFASFSLTILDSVGRNSVWIARFLISVIEYKTVTILRMAAGAEICTMLFVAVYLLIGRSSLLTPVMYFRFLTFRYASRRNHYTRTMFYETRIMMEHLAGSEKCPAFVSTAIHSFIRLVSRFSPQVQQAS